MDRGWRALVPLLLATAIAVVACGSPPAAHPDGAGAPDQPISPPPHILFTPRHSPSAPAGSWGDPSAAARQGKRANLWSGAGRHPQWRGCQHTYDPTMTAFIFGTDPSPSPTA